MELQRRLPGGQPPACAEHTDQFVIGELAQPVLEGVHGQSRERGTRLKLVKHAASPEARGKARRRGLAASINVAEDLVEFGFGQAIEPAKRLGRRTGERF